MTEIRKKLRRGLAGILAFCVIFTSVPGMAWAAELPESEEEVLTREEVIAAAELKLIPEDAPIPYSELTEKAQTAIRTSEPVTLNQLGQFSSGKDSQYYSDLFAGDVFRAGQYGDPNTTCVVVFVKPVEKLENYSEYLITGAEKYIFLYVNKTDQDYNMKINIAGYNAKIVAVPSANTVYKLNKKKASPSNAEAASVKGDGSAVTGDSIKNGDLTGKDAASVEETTTAGAAKETAADETTAAVVTEESTADETTAADTTDDTAVIETSAADTTDESIAVETSAQDTAETPAEQSAENKENESGIISGGEAQDTTAAPEESSAESEAASEASAANEPAETQSEPSEDSTESELDVIASLSKSPHSVPVVGVPVAGEVYEGEANSPAEEYNLMRGLPADYEEEIVDEDYDYTGSEEPADQMADYSAAVIRITGLLEEEEVASPSVATRSFIPRMFLRSGSEPVAVGASEETVESVAESAGGTFDVSFYDYISKDIGGSPNKDILALPGAKDKQDRLLIGNQFTGVKNQERPTHGNQNLWIEYILRVGNNKDQIAMQGIAQDKYDENGKIQFNYVTGPIFGKSGAGNNPSMAGIKKYEKVNVIEETEDAQNAFFRYDDNGNFVFDSSKNKASLISETNASGKKIYTLQGEKVEVNGEDPGFWPLKGYNNASGNNEYFGMTLSFDFVLPEKGQITTPDNKKKNMVFEFTGDDDVWVYLRKADSKEGRLALDLGGIHGATGGKIDFSNGLITHDKVWTRNNKETKAVYWYLYNDKNVGESIDGKPISKVVGLSREDWAEYTLDFYYMERGGWNSNCKIVANMPTIPRDKVTVYKSVAGETEETDFEMGLQTRDSSGHWKTIETTSVKKNHKVDFKTELPAKTEYRVVETKTSAPVTSWQLGDQTQDGLESPVGIVGENNLAICFNNYDFAPSISKKAIQEQEEQDLYWISLGITGNSTIQKTIDGTDQPYYIKEVDVEDILTEYVNFELSNDVPQIKLKLKKSGESNFKELDAQVEKTLEGKYRILYSEHEIAVIDRTEKGEEITWKAVDPSYGFGNFDENTSVVLSYLVRVSDNAEYREDVSEYKDQADSNTGTHSRNKGYHSNVEATAQYNTTLVSDVFKQLTFKKPVVRPLKPEGSLTITKRVDSELEKGKYADKAFEFTIELSNIRVKSFKAGKTGALQNIDTDGNAKLSFSLKDDESYEITGLNKETKYKIAEGLYLDVRFYSNLNNISVTKNGLADASGISITNRTAEGTLMDVDGSRTQYYYNTASSVTGNEFHYNNEEIIVDAIGQDGWYDNGELIPKDDNRFYKTESGSVKRQGWPSRYYWKWNKISYYSQDALISALTSAGWHAEKNGTKVDYSRSTKLTNSELLNQGYEYRRYSEKTVTVPASNKASAIVAVFTNSFEKRESITVQKVVQTDQGRDAVNEIYSYQVELYDVEKAYQPFVDYTIKLGTETTASYDSEKGVFTITGAGSVELIIDEAVKNGLFRIKEIDKGTADEVKWTVSGSDSGSDSDSDYSKPLQNGETAVCTNYYYNNKLTITKELSADSYSAAPEDSKKFSFTVELKDKSENPLEQIGYQTQTGVELGDYADTDKRIINLEEGKFTFTMAAGGELKLDRIPSGAKYTVTENSFADTRYGDYYNAELVSVKKNEEEPSVPTTDKPLSPTVSGNFGKEGSSEVNRDQKVAYTNKITPIRRAITVEKLITDKFGNSITNDGDGETFIFEIINIDKMSPGYGEKFYASVITVGGKGSMTINDVFAGSYSVQEMKHMRFKPVGNAEAKIDVISESGTVEFKNYRSSSEYFSDSKAAINKVNEKGFTRTSSEDSRKDSIKPVALPPAMLKHDEILFGEGSFDSEDIPFYG